MGFDRTYRNTSSCIETWREDTINHISSFENAARNAGWVIVLDLFHPPVFPGVPFKSSCYSDWGFFGGPHYLFLVQHFFLFAGCLGNLGYSTGQVFWSNWGQHKADWDSRRSYVSSIE